MLLSLNKRQAQLLALLFAQTGLLCSLIKRRCRMVPAHMESDGVMFDENALIEVLYRKPEPPDASYIREFMYP
jgi:hypothetical protein